MIKADFLIIKEKIFYYDLNKIIFSLINYYFFINLFGINKIGVYRRTFEKIK